MKKEKDIRFLITDLIDNFFDYLVDNPKWIFLIIGVIILILS